ncbi:uncharacterized protein conserved in bacteria [Coriobacteriaceae bacterium EMTCatB1]|nr:uncharacterized protein conserved in bacteria [Coriobacteriaceae bacterium EMTCatB1]
MRLKKPHPCGANEWEVTKLGMDIGLKCRGCGRAVRLMRYDFDRRFRGYVERVQAADESSAREPSSSSEGAEDGSTRLS